jgi:hypothetical protein
LISVFVVCLLLGLISVSRPVAVSFTTFPFNLAIPALGWEAWDANSLESAVRPLGSWLWAVFQWTIYYGQYLTVAFWAGFVWVILHVRAQSVQRTVDSVAPTIKDRTGAFFRSLGVPAITLAALALVAYLVIVPSVLNAVERGFQAEIAFARRPIDHWTRVEQAVGKVLADDGIMKELREAVQIEISAKE